MDLLLEFTLLALRLGLRVPVVFSTTGAGKLGKSVNIIRNILLDMLDLGLTEEMRKVFALDSNAVEPLDLVLVGKDGNLFLIKGEDYIGLLMVLVLVHNEPMALDHWPLSCTNLAGLWSLTRGRRLSPSA